MSVEQYQREVNSLDKDLADLEKKKASADSKYAELQSKITSASAAIKRTSSASTVKSKLHQIEGWNKESDKKAKESADLGKKIADKRKKRNDSYIKLQKAQQEGDKKQDKQIKNMQISYENRIRELTNQLSMKTVISEVGNTYVDTNEEYDVFVSHAWEDKEGFVDEFVAELEKLGIKVWYDKQRIKWGDSMRARIDDGLKKSKFGIAVISPDYIADGKYWTKAELDGLFQLESVNGKILLPIWHNITKQQVMNYSPIIASKLAMTTASMTAEEIASELKNMLFEFGRDIK